MKQYYDNELNIISGLAVGATIVGVEHNEDADEGMIITLDTGTKLVIGWSSNEGSCDVTLGNPSEVLKVKITTMAKDMANI